MIRLLLLISFLSGGIRGSQTPTTPVLPSNSTLIKTKEQLIQFAEPKLFRVYGKDKILSEKPYVIKYKAGIWTMKGSLPTGQVGGTFLIIVSARDGTIRKLTHYK